MAREFRRIIFSNDELRAAIEKSSGSIGAKVPKGDIVTIRSRNRKNRFFFELSLFDYAKQKSGVLDIAQDDAKTALIEHCIAADIVLPKTARKELRDIDDNLCLELFID